ESGGRGVRLLRRERLSTDFDTEETSYFLCDIRVMLYKFRVSEDSHEELGPFFCFVGEECEGLDTAGEHFRSGLVAKGCLDVPEANRERNRGYETVCNDTAK